MYTQEHWSGLSGYEYDMESEHFVISALYEDPRRAQAAVRELRQVGVPPEDISLISRQEDRPQGEDTGPAGVPHEAVEDENLTYRASRELPNDEDLATTEAQMTGKPVPVPGMSPAGQADDGSTRHGLGPDSDMVRRNEAEADADEDIYTDFPDQPGGINPDSPMSASAGADVHEGMESPPDAAHGAAAGLGLGSLTGLLVGMAGLAIPGVGPFIAAGPLAGALSGLVTGAATGGIVGALSTIGLPDEYAREYAASIVQGQTLISVQTDDVARDLVERVLVANGGDNVRCS